MLKRTILFAGISLFALGSVSGKTRAELTQERVAANPKAKWWEQMDTGPFISDTFLGFGPKGDVAVLKGIAIKLGEKEDHTVVFDTETLRMVAGFKGNVKMAGTPWSGRHADNSYRRISQTLPLGRFQLSFVSSKSKNSGLVRNALSMFRRWPVIAWTMCPVRRVSGSRPRRF